MRSPIRVLMIDDHTLFRESLLRLLEAEGQVKVVAHGATLADALQYMSKEQIDVVLLDYDLGSEFGTDLLTQLGQDHGARILMLTAGMPDAVMFRALNNGLSGIVFKHSETRQLVEAIHKVAEGEVWVEKEILRTLIVNAERSTSDTGSAMLTARQHDVLSCVLDGLSNKEIAARLDVSETAVKASLQELFRKAGVRTRSQLVRVAIEKYSDWLRPRSSAD